MRSLVYILAVAGVVVAQNNETVQTLKAPSPSLTEEPQFSVEGGGGYGTNPTCKAETKTIWKDKPYTLTLPASTITVVQSVPRKTITTTCTETKYETKTQTSTSTCTIVGRFSHFWLAQRMHKPLSWAHDPILWVTRGTLSAQMKRAEANEIARLKQQRSQALIQPLPK